MKFLRNLLASIFGTIIAISLLFVLFLIMVAAFGESESIVVKNNSVLELSLQIPIKDYAPKSSDPIDEFLGYNDFRMGLNEITNAIENAKSDPNISGISIRTLGVNSGLAQTQSIRKKLQEFRDTGKFVLAYADLYDQKSYYLSSVAEAVYLNPIGAVDFKGLGSEVLFFKDLQEKTGVKLEVIRHGKYKSAVEPFMSNEMSDNNRFQISAFMKAIWTEMLKEISRDRQTTTEDLNKIADELLGRNAKLALENRLIDGTIYQDEYDDILKEELGISGGSTVQKVSMRNYIATGKGRLKATGSDRIAVIYAQGDIIYGKGDEDFIGQDLIIKALKKARKSKMVKAIVLRVDSPGGSAITSELIWRELELTKKEKPLVVSMGNVAASGGYYLACNSDRIFAEPMTITGSIGVFGVVPNISELSKNIGINAEQVKTNKGADYSLFEPMSSEFRDLAIEGVEQVYTTFLERVANGRNMSETGVDSVAQGRVWSGIEAKNIGLVDELGGLEDAIQYAADLAEISEYRVRNYPDYNMSFEERLGGFPFVKTTEKILTEELGEEQYLIYNSLKKFSKLKGIQARIPFEISIQ